MNSDVPFIITVKASNIYDNNNRYNIINNIKNKELINCLREYIVFVNEWGGEGRWSYISNITIRFTNGEIMEHVSGYYLFLTEESLEKYGWYFKEDDY